VIMAYPLSDIEMALGERAGDALFRFLRRCSRVIRPSYCAVVIAGKVQIRYCRQMPSLVSQIDEVYLQVPFPLLRLLPVHHLIIPSFNHPSKHRSSLSVLDIPSSLPEPLNPAVLLYTP
jgi:hypothetical protein